MQVITSDIEKKIQIIQQAVEDHTKLNIIASGLYGSMLRGYADPNSDLDICFLVKRPVSDYLDIGETRKEVQLANEVRQQEYIGLSNTISRLTGINVMVAIVDVKELLVGLMANNLFSLCVYQYFKQSNPDVEKLFKEPLDLYYNTSNVILRTGNTIRHSLTNAMLNKNANDNEAYKQERTYLSTLWHCHCVLALISGDKQVARPLKELLEINKETWSEKVPILFSGEVVGVYKARVNRNHFQLPVVLGGLNLNALQEGADQVLNIASSYVHANPTKTKSAFAKAGTVLDFYDYLYELEEANKA